MLYFDGNSAAKLDTGTFDTQDVLLYGHARRGCERDEWNRIVQLCEWGKEFGIDGFVRMEYDL